MKSSVNQIEMISLEELVPQDDEYRKILKLIDFEKLTNPLKKKEKK